ncbi:MAG: hypothetical protein PHY72_03790 [Candidatus Pacebacteria bacterium]|nr:hypothetical protein [Candidatus Paceibacterota bacterium]
MKSYKPSHLQKKIKVKRKAIKRRRFIQSRVFFDIVLAVLLVSLLIYLLFFSRVFKIQSIQISSFAEVSKENILAVVKEEMQARILFFVKKDSFFLISPKNIEQDIANKFPLISKVSVKKGLSGNIFIEAKPRIAQAIWCFATPKISAEEGFGIDNKNCFLADQQRILFSQMTPETPKDNLVFINSELAIKPIFSEACSEDLLERIIETNKVLNDFNLFNSTFTEKSNGFLYVETIDSLSEKGEWNIYFNPKQDLASDMLKLRLLLDKEITPEKRKTLEYIDLRFTKAYYK